MSKRPSKMIHWQDALTLLESGQPCDLKVWKLSTGDILEYRGAVCVGHSFRYGNHRIVVAGSSLIREFRDVTLFEINGYEIIR
ncbi:MAG: maintenance system killer protein [Bacteroides sp.]|nr:maintenance system killer protein [Bacteroides sp.]